MSDKSKTEISKIGLLRARLKVGIPVKDLESLSDASSISKHVETIMDQIKHLQNAISTTIEKAKIQPHRKPTACMYFLFLFFFSKFVYEKFNKQDDFVVRIKINVTVTGG